MKYDLSALASRATNRRRKSVTLRPIIPTQTLASDLYASSYKPIVTTITNAIPHLIAAYQRSAPGLIRDAETDDAHSVLTTIGDDLRRLVLTLAPGIRIWAGRVQKWHQDKWRAATLTATGIDLATILLASGTPATVQDTINWNTALVRDVSEQAQARMSSAVFAAYSGRKSAADLASDLRDVAAMSRRRSLGIASDQMSKLSSALDAERMADAGLDRFVYHHSGKLHPRPWHQARDRRTYELASGREVGGSDVIAPDDAPGVPPWCGCRRRAVVTF